MAWIEADKELLKYILLVSSRRKGMRARGRANKFSTRRYRRADAPPHLIIPDLNGLGLDLLVRLVDDVKAFDVSEDGSLGLPVDLDGGGAENFGFPHFDGAVLQLWSHHVQVKLGRRWPSVFCGGKRIVDEGVRL